MEHFLSFGAIALVISLVIFFYLLKTARKRTPTPAAGKKEYTPFYVTLPDRPDTIMRGIDKCENCGQVLLSQDVLPVLLNKG